MNRRPILIEKDFPLTNEEVKRLQRKYPFLTDNRIIEIRENNANEELTGTVIDPLNRTLYPYSGKTLDFGNIYEEGKIWNYIKYVVHKDLSKSDGAKEIFSKYFIDLSEGEIEELIYFAFSPWAGAVVNTDPNVREKHGEPVIFPYGCSLEKILDLYPEAEIFQWEQK